MTSTTTAADLNAERLLQTVARLWPDHDVESQRGRRRQRAARELIFVPSRSAPRLLVPAGRPAAAASGLRRFSRALSAKERAVRLVGSAALRAGAEGLLADRIRMTPRPGTADSIEQHLSEVLGTEVVVGLGVGSLRANQKPILQVFDGRGRCVAYVKVGDTDRTAGLVHAEGISLSELADHDWQLLEIPALLHLGNWQGLELLVISALDTAARPGGGPLLQPPLAPLDELYDRYDEGPAALGGSAYWLELRDTVARIEDAALRTAYQEAIQRVEDARGDEPIRLTAWHGDFAPWNLGFRRGRIAVVGLGAVRHRRSRGARPDPLRTAHQHPGGGLLRPRHRHGAGKPVHPAPSRPARDPGAARRALPRFARRAVPGRKSGRARRGAPSDDPNRARRTHPARASGSPP